MDRIIDALEVELDPEKRGALWAEAQRLYATELPSLPLYFRSAVFVLPKWLERRASDRKPVADDAMGRRLDAGAVMRGCRGP